MHIFLLFLKVESYALLFCLVLAILCGIVCGIGVGIERLILGPRDPNSRN
jgi:hypothetical protein